MSAKKKKASKELKGTHLSKKALQLIKVEPERTNAIRAVGLASQCGEYLSDHHKMRNFLVEILEEVLMNIPDEWSLSDDIMRALEAVSSDKEIEVV